MRKVVLVLALGLTCNSAMAEWTLVGDNSINRVYIDYSTLKKEGNKVNVWTMNDYKNIQTPKDEKPFISEVAKNEFDCKDETYRLVSLTSYNKNMGQGEVVYNNGNINGAATTLPPNSLGKIIWEKACGK